MYANNLNKYDDMFEENPNNNLQSNKEEKGPKVIKPKEIFENYKDINIKKQNKKKVNKKNKIS